MRSSKTCSSWSLQIVEAHSRHSGSCGHKEHLAGSAIVARLQKHFFSKDLRQASQNLKNISGSREYLFESTAQSAPCAFEDLLLESSNAE